jgi:hypothetical protein
MKQIAALDQYNARVDSLVVKFSGKKVADQIRETADAVKRLKGNITGPELIELQHQLSAWVVEGRQLPPILDDIWAKNISIAEVVPQVTTDIRDLTAGFTDLWPQMKRSAEASTAFVGSLKELQKPLGPMLDNILDSMTKVKLPPPSAAQKSGLALMFQDVANDLPDVIQKAFQGGGSVGKSVGGSLMSSIIGRKEDWTTFFKASGLGTTIGGALGSVIPGLGTLLGGALGGLVGKLFGPSKTQIAGREADKEIDAIRAKLVGPNGLFGSFNELQSAALELGLTFSDAWVGRGVDGLAQLTSRLEQFEQKQQAVKALQDALGGGIDRLSSAVQVFGGVVPPALRPMVESLLTSKSLTEQMRGALRGMTEDSSWQSMQARAEALGINLRDLGEHFSQARLGEIAQGYARDIAAFSEQGANMEGVLRGMADELSTLFNDAKATGAELPETLRPWMQRLVDAGLLVDDAGRKLEDLNGVTFEEMEDRALGAVVDILEEIRDLLARGLPAAAREGAEGIAGAFRDLPPVEIDVVARRPHVYAETDDSGPPIFDTPMRRVTRSGWGWLNPGDVAGMPHLTPGATAGGGVNLSVTINANDADSVARWMRRTGGDAFIQLLRESGVHRAGMQRVLS